MYSNEPAEQTTIPYGKYGQVSISLVDGFFTEFFETLSPMIHGEATGPPPSDFTGNAIWGVQPGDLITWNYSHGTFTGTIGTGMSQSDGSGSTTWEIIEITEDNRAVLIGEHRTNIKIFNEYFSSVILDTPYNLSTWHTIDDGPIVLETNSLSQATIYPLYREGKTIASFLEDEVEYLPEKTFTETSRSISVYARTSPGMGFTPLVTQWIDITIHKGTGLLTSYGSYYNDDEFSITVSRAGELAETNIDLASRVFNVQIKNMISNVSSDTLEKGEKLTLTVNLEDLTGNPIDGATVTASLGGEEVILLGIGDGIYEKSMETSLVSVGDHNIELSALKEGFEPGSDSETITLETPNIFLSLEMDETIRKGRKATITTEVRDISSNPVEGVDVTATISEIELTLTDMGGGQYQARFETKELEI